MTQEILVSPTTSGLYIEQCNRKKSSLRFLLKDRHRRRLKSTDCSPCSEAGVAKIGFTAFSEIRPAPRNRGGGSFLGKIHSTVAAPASADSDSENAIARGRDSSNLRSAEISIREPIKEGDPMA